MEKCKSCKSRKFTEHTDGDGKPFKLLIHKKDCEYIKRMFKNSIEV